MKSQKLWVKSIREVIPGEEKIMKKLLLVSALCAMGTQVLAEDIYMSKECPGGGSKELSGVYDTQSGDFELTAELKDCGLRRGMVNGTHISKGNFSMENALLGATAKVNVTIESDLKIQGKHKDVSYKCSKEISGDYDIANNSLNGKMTSNCNQEGKMHFPLLELLSGEESELENESGESKPENEPNSKPERPEIPEHANNSEQAENAPNRPPHSGPKPNPACDHSNGKSKKCEKAEFEHEPEEEFEDGQEVDDERNDSSDQINNPAVPVDFS